MRSGAAPQPLLSRPGRAMPCHGRGDLAALAPFPFGNSGFAPPDARVQSRRNAPLGPDTEKEPAMMEEGFRIVVLPPFGNAYTSFIDGDYDSMSSVVGGLIEHLSLDAGTPSGPDRGIDFWCNEEFLYADSCPFNRVVTLPDGSRTPIFGQMFACAYDPYDGESLGLTFEEALSILERQEIRLPQLLDPSILSEAGGTVRVDVLNASNSSMREILEELSRSGNSRHILQLLSNKVDLGEDGGIQGLPLPLVGSPEDLIFGKWRVHMVYPGDRVADGPNRHVPQGSPRPADAKYDLPIVEFWDMSQDRSSFPKGQFVSSYYMTTLMNLDGLNPYVAPGRGLDSLGDRFDLFGGSPCWTISGEPLRAAKEFIQGTYDSLSERRALSLAPEDAARAARSAAERGPAYDGGEAASRRR